MLLSVAGHEASAREASLQMWVSVKITAPATAGFSPFPFT